eukprot:Amastigsp_a3181_189.p4 type:complete len:119 gc:universal Amastigsp_a3181_189:871-515(-)
MKTSWSMHDTNVTATTPRTSSAKRNMETTMGIMSSPRSTHRDCQRLASLSREASGGTKILDASSVSASLCKSASSTSTESCACQNVTPEARRFAPPFIIHVSAASWKQIPEIARARSE